MVGGGMRGWFTNPAATPPCQEGCLRNCEGGMYRLAFAVVATCLVISAASHGDVKNWQTGQTIPGTEDIVPGPGVNLGGWRVGKNLNFADLKNLDLHGAYFYGSWLNYATFENSDLTGANFYTSQFTGANFSGALIRGANFYRIGMNSLTAALVYSTRSYQEKDLRETSFSNNAMGGWDFSLQNMTGGNFYKSRLVDTCFRGATLASCDFRDTFYGLISLFTRRWGMLYSWKR